MRVLFLELDTENEWAVASLGPGFLAAWLRRHGHEARIPARAAGRAARRDRASRSRRIEAG
jgi:hypothetical protein